MESFNEVDPISTQYRQQQQLTRQALWPALVLCALVTVGFAWLNNWPGPAVMTARDQNRLNQALDAPSPGNPIEFAFESVQDGLTSIELTIVNFETGGETVPVDIGGAQLTLLDAAGQIVVERQLVPSAVAHNDVITLRFDPISNSRGALFTLRMTGESGNPLSLWGYGLNVWPESQLQGPVQNAETLSLKTSYAFQWHTLPSIIGNQLGRFGLAILLAIFWLPLPGILFFQLFPALVLTRPVRLALSYALGISLWALFWLWVGLLGLRMTGLALWILFGGGWILFAYVHIRKRALKESGKLRESAIRWAVDCGPLLLFLIGVLILRLLAVRDLSFLPWVDASRHALITAVMRDSGQFIETYRPYLPVDRLPYHYGFHTLSASLALMVGNRVPIIDMFLGLMQLLSTLTTLAAYAGGVLLTGKRSVGWVAAFLISLPLLFPGYYTTWGRLTQITGMIIFPILIGLMWRLANREIDGQIDSGAALFAPPLTGLVVCTALLSAALFLIHARVFLYFLPYALILGGHALFARSMVREGDYMRLLGWRQLPAVWLALAGGGGLFLILPRLYVLLTDVGDQLTVGTVSTGVSYLSFPTGYLTFGWETAIWWGLFLGTANLFAVTLALAPLSWFPTDLRRLLEQGSLQVIYIWLWIGLLYLAVSGPALHPSWPLLLPQTNLNSAYITLFSFQGVLLGILIWSLVEMASRLHWLAHIAAYMVLGVLIAAGTLFGIKNQLTILNETTILGRTADLDALLWIDDHLPEDAKVAHSSWRWLQTTWAGSDGGAWITPLTGRLSSMPPVDYSFDPAFSKEIREFNEIISDVDDWSSADALSQLKLEGYSHIMIGEKGGFFDPAELYANPAVTPVYDSGRAWVFEIQD
ncbi:MAG: hypothetical protein AAF633_08915 [Chloroflexota bacterium]